MPGILGTGKPCSVTPFALPAANPCRQALLGLSRLQLPSPAYSQEGAKRLRLVVASQAERLRVQLLDDRSYAEHLPPPDRWVPALRGLVPYAAGWGGGVGWWGVLGEGGPRGRAGGRAG